MGGEHTDGREKQRNGKGGKERRRERGMTKISK